MSLRIILFGVTVLVSTLPISQAGSTSRRGRERAALQGEIKTLKETQEMLHGDIADLRNVLDAITETLTSSLPEDCSAAKTRGSWSTSALVRPPGLSPRMVRCEQYEDGGGWTVILARRPTQIPVDFNNTWQLYKDGFGDINGEFWIGNEVLHALTKEVPHHLRVVLTDWKGVTTTALWNSFTVKSEAERYELGIDGYVVSSTAGNALYHHNGRAFSTHDKDNDMDPAVHCAQTHGGGWWYHQCYTANPTGVALGPNQNGDHGIIWRPGRNKISLKDITMMIKPSHPASYPTSEEK